MSSIASKREASSEKIVHNRYYPFAFMPEKFLQRSSPDNYKTQIRRLKKHLESLGYTGDAKNYIMSRLRFAINQFENKNNAAKALVEGFLKYAKRAFSRRQLKIFIRNVNPTFIEDGDIRKARLPWPHQMGSMKPRERKEYFVKLKKLQKRVSAERRKHPEQVFAKKEKFEILNSVTWRGIPKDFPVSDYDRKQPIEISTPMGGMPGWRRRMKRR